MTKYDLERLVLECLSDYLSDTSFKPSTIKENTMKKSELKALVNEVVRQCVQEAGPQYKVRGKKSQLEQPGLRNKAREMQCDPQINEEFEEIGVNGGESGAFDGSGGGEESEVELLKQMAQILLKLLQKHRGEGTDDFGGEDGSPDDSTPNDAPEASTDAPDASPEDEEELKESNHKVQIRSLKTVKDLPNNPKNVRNPKVPQS